MTILQLKMHGNADSVDVLIAAVDVNNDVPDDHAGCSVPNDWTAVI